MVNQEYNPFITGQPIFTVKMPKFMETTESEDIKLINEIGDNVNKEYIERMTEEILGGDRL